MRDQYDRTAAAAGLLAGPTVPRQDPGAAAAAPARPDAQHVVTVRRTGSGWRVGDEELPDLISAMILADLLAPGLAGPGRPVPGQGEEPGDAAADAARLEATVAQLEHALATRVRVEQAIGVIAERRRVPPREAFGLLRTAARADGTRVAELAARVVESAVNPLLILPEELARPPRQARPRGKSPRHVRVGD